MVAPSGRVRCTSMTCAYAERFVLPIKSECLSKLVPLGERHLRRVVSEFVKHFHLERNHQGLENRLLTPTTPPENENLPIDAVNVLAGS
jgi:transposase InsO family protein